MGDDDSSCFSLIGSSMIEYRLMEASAEEKSETNKENKFAWRKE